MLYRYISIFTNPKKLDAKLLTKHVSRYLRGRGHWCIIPNVYIHPLYEMDIMSIKGRGLIETEIKVSRGDFRRDSEKGKHRLIQKGRYPANFFYYACPTGVIQPSELPGKAGLLWVSERGTVSMKREAMRINSQPMRDRFLLKIARKIDKKLRYS